MKARIKSKKYFKQLMEDVVKVSRLLEIDDDTMVSYKDDDGEEHEIQYSSAMAYDEDHPAKKAALAMTDKSTDSGEEKQDSTKISAMDLGTAAERDAQASSANGDLDNLTSKKIYPNLSPKEAKQLMKKVKDTVELVKNDPWGQYDDNPKNILANSLMGIWYTQVRKAGRASYDIDPDEKESMRAGIKKYIEGDSPDNMTLKQLPAELHGKIFGSASVSNSSVDITPDTLFKVKPDDISVEDGEVDGRDRNVKMTININGQQVPVSLTTDDGMSSVLPDDQTYEDAFDEAEDHILQLAIDKAEGAGYSLEESVKRFQKLAGIIKDNIKRQF